MKLLDYENGQQKVRWGFQVVLLFTVSLALRVYGLGDQELWLDEAYTAFLTYTPDWQNYLLRDTNPPLYYLILKAWTVLFGVSEFSLRMPSAIFGAMTVVFFCLTTRLLSTNQIAVIFACLLCFSPLHVFYSQEARVYALMTCAMMAYCWCSVSLLSGRQNKGLIATLYVLALIIIFCHYFASLFLIASFVVHLSIYLKNQYRTVNQHLLIAPVIAAGIFLFWLIFTWSDLQAQLAQTYWTEQLSLPLALKVPASIMHFLFGPVLISSGLFLKQFNQVSLSGVAEGVAWAGTALLLLIILSRLFLRAINDVFWIRYFFFLFILPLLMFMAMELAGFNYYVVARYDLVTLPAFFCLLAISGYATLPVNGRPIQLAVPVILATILLLQGFILLEYHRYSPVRQNETIARSLLVSTLKADDTLIISDPVALIRLYYFYRLGLRWNGENCVSSEGLTVYCRFSPPEFIRTPAANLVYRRYQDRTPDHYNIAAWKLPLEQLDGLWLITALLYQRNKQWATDKVTANLLERLHQEGFKIVRVIPQKKLLRLER